MKKGILLRLGGSMELNEEELGFRYQVRFFIAVILGEFRSDFFPLVVVRSEVEF